MNSDFETYLLSVDIAWQTLVNLISGLSLEDVSLPLAACAVILPIAWKVQGDLTPWIPAWQRALDWLSFAATVLAAIWFGVAAAVFQRLQELIYRSFQEDAWLFVPVSVIYTFWAGHTLRNFARRRVCVSTRVKQVRREGYAGDWQPCSCSGEDGSSHDDVMVPPELAEPGSQILVERWRSALTGRYLGHAKFVALTPRLEHVSPSA